MGMVVELVMEDYVVDIGYINVDLLVVMNVVVDI